MDGSRAKRRAAKWFTRHVLNPVMTPLAGRVPWWVLLETTGRRTDKPHVHPVGGRLIDNAFWLVAEHGTHADFVRNIVANDHVRVFVQGAWRSGTARLVDQEPPRRLGWVNQLGIRFAGTEPRTVRIEFGQED